LNIRGSGAVKPCGLSEATFDNTGLMQNRQNGIIIGLAPVQKLVPAISPERADHTDNPL
jgi:hypothetical protein